MKEETVAMVERVVAEEVAAVARMESPVEPAVKARASPSCPGESGDSSHEGKRKPNGNAFHGDSSSSSPGSVQAQRPRKSFARKHLP
jgi:hypothetical protein